MFNESEIVSVSLNDTIVSQNSFKQQQTELQEVQDVQIQTIRRKTQQTQANEVYEPYKHVEIADLSHLQNSLLLALNLVQQQPLKIIFEQKDQLLKHNYISLRQVLGELSSKHRVFIYYQGKLKIYEDNLISEIYPFYPQVRNLQSSSTSSQLKNITYSTPTTQGTQEGNIYTDQQLVPSMHVSNIISIIHHNDFVLSCDSLGRILLFKGQKLVSGVIIRDKQLKRDFEEGMFTSTFSLNSIRKNCVYASIGAFDGTVITFQFNQIRNLDIQRIEELSDYTGAGMRISSQFQVKPPVLELKCIKLWENSSQFMQSVLNSGVLVLDGQNQVKLYCSGQFICAYESSGVVSFDVIENNVIILTKREILCFELFRGITVNKPYFKASTPHIYNKIQVVSGGDKIVIFLSNQDECELREVIIRPSRNNLGQEIYKMLQE